MNDNKKYLNIKYKWITQSDRYNISGIVHTYKVQSAIIDDVTPAKKSLIYKVLRISTIWPSAYSQRVDPRPTTWRKEGCKKKKNQLKYIY